MKKVKLTVLALAAAVLMPFAMTSCKKEEPAPKKETPAKGKEKAKDKPTEKTKKTEHPEHPK